MKTYARIALLPLLLAAGLFGAEAGTVLSSKTPFGPARGAGGPAEAASETIEFTGVSTIGKRTDFVLYDKTTKKSQWIAKGETKGGISLLNYDQKSEQVVVKINGGEKTLKLRRPASTFGAARAVAPVATGFNLSSPASAVAPATATDAASLPSAPAPANVGPAAPLTQAQQETEARMLVSDLLEIGMAQRKAYEEKLKQSGGSPTPPADAAGAAPPKSGG